jgi:hypothetical protein
MGQARDDLAVLMRCWRFGRGMPAAVIFGWRMFTPLLRAYDTVVAPVVARDISDAGEIARVNQALRAMSVKIGETMVAYAALTGHPPDVTVAALAGAVTRLYDDLIDGAAGEDAALGDRLGHILAGRPAQAASALESLLAHLVSEIRLRLGLQDGDVPVTALLALHDYQWLSRGQREPSTPGATLDKICRGKGALANLTLCGLVNPQLDSREREIVMSLGEALQSLDDYMDVSLDIQSGVATPASTGAITFADIAAEIGALREPFALRYGIHATRRYYGMLCFLLCKSVTGRRLPFLGQLASRLAGRFDSLSLLTRGAEVMT